MGVGEFLETLYKSQKRLTQTRRPYFLRSLTFLTICRRIHKCYEGVTSVPQKEQDALGKLVKCVEEAIILSTDSKLCDREDLAVNAKFEHARDQLDNFLTTYQQVALTWPKSNVGDVFNSVESEYERAAQEDATATKYLAEILESLKKKHLYSTVSKITFRLNLWNETIFTNGRFQSTLEEFEIEKRATIDVMICRLFQVKRSFSLCQNPQLYDCFPKTRANFVNKSGNVEDIQPVLPWKTMSDVVGTPGRLDLNVIVDKLFNDQLDRPSVPLLTAQGVVKMAEVPKGYRNLWHLINDVHSGFVVVRDLSGALSLFKMISLKFPAINPGSSNTLVDRLARPEENPSHARGRKQGQRPERSQNPSGTSLASTSTASTVVDPNVSSIGPSAPDKVAQATHDSQQPNNYGSSNYSSPRKNDQSTTIQGSLGSLPSSVPNVQAGSPRKASSSTSVIQQSGQGSTEPKQDRPSGNAVPSTSAPGAPVISGSTQRSTPDPWPSSTSSTAPSVEYSQQAPKATQATPAATGVNTPATSSRATTPTLRSPPTLPSGSGDTLVGGQSQDTPSHSMSSLLPGTAALALRDGASASSQGKKSGRTKPGLENTQNLHRKNRMETLQEDQLKKGVLSRLGYKVSSWVFGS